MNTDKKRLILSAFISVYQRLTRFVSALQRFVARPRGVAFVVVRHLAIRPKAIAGMQAPEGAIVAVRDRGVPHSFDVQTLPAEVLAAFRANPRQTSTFAEIGVH